MMLEADSWLSDTRRSMLCANSKPIEKGGRADQSIAIVHINEDLDDRWSKDMEVWTSDEGKVCWSARALITRKLVYLIVQVAYQYFLRVVQQYRRSLIDYAWGTGRPKLAVSTKGHLI